MCYEMSLKRELYRKPAQYNQLDITFFKSRSLICYITNNKTENIH